MSRSIVCRTGPRSRSTCQSDRPCLSSGFKFRKVASMDSKQDRSHATGQSFEDIEANPYTATSFEASSLQTAVFSQSYWIVAWSLFLMSLVIFIVSLWAMHWSFALGLLSLLSSVFALGRSLATTLRIRAYRMSETAIRLREREIAFLFGSFLLGGIASIASCIAFFAICIPVGSVFFEFQGPRGNLNADQVIIPLSIVSGVIGFLLGCFFIYLTLPSLRREMRLSDKEP